MPYTKTIWTNSSGEALNEANLNKIENGILVGVSHAESAHADPSAVVDSNYVHTDNNYTTSEKSKLATLESSHFRGEFTSLVALQTAIPTGISGDYADVDAGVGATIERYIWDTNTVAWVLQLGVSSLLTDTQVKTQYENNPDTNVFTDAEKTKLGTVESGAQANTVTSVSGRTGIVTLTKGDVGLANVDNTSDLNKPISSAAQSALDAKVDDSQVLTNVPTGAVFTDTTYSVGDGGLTTKDFTQTKSDKLDLFNEELQYFFVGAILDNVEGNISSDGTTVTATLQKIGGGDIHYQTHTGTRLLDTTPAASTTLTPGTNTNPIKNYMYIDILTDTFTSNITGYPTTEHVPLATSIVPSAAFVQSSGTYATHQLSDEIFSSNENGHLSHLNKWIRNQPATWISGNALTYTGSGSTTVNASVSSGEMFQLHKHNTENIASPASFYIYNDQVTKYKSSTNLATILTDTTGGSLNNKYFSLVFWYVFSQIPGDSKLYVNKPSGSYASESDARSDSLKYSNFSIPQDFLGTSFLIKRLICRNSGGVLTVYPGPGDDLRGTLPNTASGSSTSVSSTFLDSSFRVQNLVDTTKQIAFSGNSLTTGTTRTLTIQDKNITVAGLDDITRTTRTITSNSTVVIKDLLTLVDATSGNITVTIPTAVGNSGIPINVKRIDNTNNTVTIQTTSSQTIDSVLTLTLSQWDNMQIVSNNTNWYVI